MRRVCTSNYNLSSAVLAIYDENGNRITEKGISKNEYIGNDLIYINVVDIKEEGVYNTSAGSTYKYYHYYFDISTAELSSSKTYTIRLYAYVEGQPCIPHDTNTFYIDSNDSSKDSISDEYMSGGNEQLSVDLLLEEEIRAYCMGPSYNVTGETSTYSIYLNGIKQVSGGNITVGGGYIYDEIMIGTPECNSNISLTCEKAYEDSYAGQGTIYKLVLQGTFKYPSYYRGYKLDFTDLTFSGISFTFSTVLP